MSPPNGQARDHAAAEAADLALTCAHVGAMGLISRRATKCVMVSDYRISHPIGEPEQFRLVTDLNRAAFFRSDPRTGQIVACRRSVSSVLLCAVSDTMTSVLGLLHSDPVKPFKPETLASVPMLSVTNWPERGSGIQTAWSRRGGEHLNYYHERVRVP